MLLRGVKRTRQCLSDFFCPEGGIAACALLLSVMTIRAQILEFPVWLVRRRSGKSSAGTD